MKKTVFLLLTFAILIGFGTSSYAIPVGAEFSVDESNDPLVLGFTGLTGSLSFEFFNETLPVTSGPWNVTLFKDAALASFELGRIEFFASSTAWTAKILTHATALTGDVTLYAFLDDGGVPNDAITYFRGFSSSPTYISGGQPVPEPATMLLLATGLIGLAGFGRKEFYKK